MDSPQDAPRVWFASDTHFGAGTREDQERRVARFTRWLDGIAAGEQLYLLGDIFDFWLDYPGFMPKQHLEVLYGLRRLQDRGGRIAFVGGNHDVWCADYLEDSLGIPALPNGSVVEHQGLRLRLDHGDGLLSGDRFYGVYRWAVRHPVLVFLAKSIHPELLHRFADWLSRTSRSKDHSTAEEIVELVRRYGRSHDHGDVDHLVIGHIHQPHQERFGGWVFNCLGDWVVHDSYGLLEGGELRLHQLEGAHRPVELPVAAAAG